MISLALLQARDVHPNTGPLEDLLQILSEQTHNPTFNIPCIVLSGVIFRRSRVQPKGL